MSLTYYIIRTINGIKYSTETFETWFFVDPVWREKKPQMCNTLLDKNKTIKQNSLKGDTEFMVDSLNSESKLHQEENFYIRYWNGKINYNLKVYKKKGGGGDWNTISLIFLLCNYKHFTILTPCVNKKTEYIKIRSVK